MRYSGIDTLQLPPKVRDLVEVYVSTADKPLAAAFKQRATFST